MRDRPIETQGAGGHGVIAKLTALVDVFVAGPDNMTLDEIALLAGLPRSTTSRMLRQLVDLRWLEHDQRGYRLGARMRGVGHRVESHLPLRSAATRSIYDLHIATAGLVHLAVLDGDSIVMIDKLGEPSETIPTTVGTRYHAEQSVVGRAMLATLSPEDVDDVLRDPGRATGRLHDRLSTIRTRHGISITTDDMPWNLRGVGAAIMGPDGPVGAISVGFPGRAAPVERFIPLLARAVRQTSQLFVSSTRAGGSQA